MYIIVVLHTLLLVALIADIAGAVTHVISRDNVDHVVDTSAAVAHSGHLHGLIASAGHDQSGTTAVVVLPTVADAELSTIVEFINSIAVDQVNTHGPGWAREKLATMDHDALCQLVTAAYDLDMRTLAATIMWTKRTWSDIVAMRVALHRDVFRFAVMNAPAVLRVTGQARTGDQAKIARTIQNLLVIGSKNVHLLNVPVWESSMNVLQWAARYGEVSVAEMLASAPGIDVNARNEFGATPLHLAVIGGHLGVVQLLVQARRIDVNPRDYMGMTPLHKAVRMGHEAIVRVLVADPAIDVNARDGNLQTPLHYAAEVLGNDRIFEMLLDVPGVDLNARNKRRLTPGEIALHVANTLTRCSM
ncbi:Ankyrin repeat domain-containing protein [Plasmodiophora brassicae]|uniref:Uncharacterized protein n=1 Tax=Plasmodiophora brassicae TaxID=37360 RepID=A0A0G4ITY6_PLABS|nr:hypothetical protein PBRA_006917 [Plasmodiophora brassicae]